MEAHTMKCPKRYRRLIEQTGLGLRRLVKDGLLPPRHALAWLQEQETVGPKIVGWLERRIRKEAT
jgi:hypothetical protein